MFPIEKAAKQNVIKYPLYLRYHRATLKHDHADVKIEYPKTLFNCGPLEMTGTFLHCSINRIREPYACFD